MKMRPLPTCRHIKIRRQEGAIGLSMALVLMSALLFTVLAVDTGRLMMEKRRLQRIADLSALHAVDVSACGGTVSPEFGNVAAAAQQVAQINGYTGDLSAEDGAVTLGSTNTVDGVRQFSANANPAESAVRVIASAEYPTSLLLPKMFGDSSRLQATAVATKQVQAVFQVGSFLARLDTKASILDGLLSGLLGTNVKLDALSYQGLINADVTLLDLINAKANVGNVDGLLQADLSVGDFLDLLIEAVGQDTTAGIALNQLSVLDIGSLPNIQLGDLLMLSGSEPNNALQAQINVFDLLVTGLQVANKEHAVDLGLGVNLNVPGILEVTNSTKLQIVEPPKIAIGPPGKKADGSWQTEATTAQLRFQLDLGLDVLSMLRPLVGITGNLGIYLDVAKAHAFLESIQCASPADPVHHVNIGIQPSLLSLGIGHFSDIESGGTLDSTPPALDVELLGLHLAIDLFVGTDVQNPDPDELTFDVAKTPIWTPPDPFPEEMTQTAATGLGASLGHAIASLVNTLEIRIRNDENNPLIALLNGVIQLVQGLLTDLVGPALEWLLSTIGGEILDPLLEALGIRLAGGDVSLISLDIRPTLLAI